MSIVLNENEWAKEMLDTCQLGKKPAETFRRVARYYLDQKYTKTETRKMLDVFLLKCDPLASVPKWSDALDRAISKAVKYPAIHIESVPITGAELKMIAQIPRVQTKRLAFTLLCLAKYRDASTNNMADHWVSTSDGDIMRLANISTSIKNQSKMYRELSDFGLIRFSKLIDNTNVRVLFTDDSDGVVFISDFRNLGNQYMRLAGGPYFECQSCGITERYSDPKNGRKQKYCKACASRIVAQQKIDYVLRKRSQRDGIALTDNGANT